jgi:hypothetical protein
MAAGFDPPRSSSAAAIVVEERPFEGRVLKATSVAFRTSDATGAETRHPLSGNAALSRSQRDEL